MRANREVFSWEAGTLASAALLGLERYAEAEQNFLQARAILVRALSADSPSLTRVTESLVKLYERTGNAGKAAEWRQKLPAED